MKSAAILKVSQQWFCMADLVGAARLICGASSIRNITGSYSSISAPAEEVRRLPIFGKIRRGILSKTSKRFASTLALKNGLYSEAHGDQLWHSAIRRNIRSMLRTSCCAEFFFLATVT